MVGRFITCVSASMVHEIVIDGGIVNCVEGVRVWALIDGREVLILIGEIEWLDMKSKEQPPVS